MDQPETYKYGYAEDDLYVERGTDRVPCDGLFYLVRSGQVGEGFDSLKRALARLSQLRAFGSGVEPATPADRALQREMTDRFLRESSNQKRARATKKGGKGGSGGVGG